MICIAKILSPFGIKGVVKIRVYASHPKDILSYNKIIDVHGNEYRIHNIIQTKEDVVYATLNNISDRDQAAKLSNVELFIERNQLPALPEGQFYHCDLIDSTLVNEDKVKIGKITAIQNFGTCDIAEIEDENGKFLCCYPLIPDMIIKFSLDDKQLIVKDLQISHEE